MFGPYEIACDGRTWHGNVTLKEHHIVARDGAHSLFRVQDMAAVPIGEALAKAIVRLLPSPGMLIPDALMEALRGCGMAAGEEAEAPSAARTEAPATAATPASRPVIAMALFLTQSCNLRCVYCYGAGGEYGGRGVMSEGTSRAAVDWLLDGSLDAEKVDISFFGGEPLLNFPLLQQVVTYAHEQAAARGKEVGFTVTTNGALLSHAVIAFLEEERIDLLISFDGPPEVQDRQRPFKNGRGSYDRVFGNVQRLRKVFPRLTARATVCRDGDPFAISRGVEEAGFATCVLSPASPVILRGEHPDDAAARGEAAERMLAYRRTQMASLFAAVAERSLDPTSPPAGLTLLAGLADGRQRHMACGVGRGLRAVAVNGDVYPCHRFVGLEEARLGHLRDDRAGEINDYHRAVVENLPVCRSCWARYFCGGGCFYHNRACTGDMHRPDPLFCHEVKTVCEDAIHGWCLLSDDDQAYVRGQAGRLDPESKP